MERVVLIQYSCMKFTRKKNIKITYTCIYVMVINEQEAMNLRQSKGGVYRKIWKKKGKRKSNLTIL